jgi:hypothetical protein
MSTAVLAALTYLSKLKTVDEMNHKTHKKL